MLNLEKALKLYLTLYPHLPSNSENMSALEFIRGIISNIKKDNPGDYADSIMIMYDIDIQDMKKKSTDELLNMFIEELSENKFLSLCDFLGSFGYATR